MTGIRSAQKQVNLLSRSETSATNRMCMRHYGTYVTKINELFPPDDEILFNAAAFLNLSSPDQN